MHDRSPCVCKNAQKQRFLSRICKYALVKSLPTLATLAVAVVVVVVATAAVIKHPHGVQSG